MAVKLLDRPARNDGEDDEASAEETGTPEEAGGAELEDCAATATDSRAKMRDRILRSSGFCWNVASGENRRRGNVDKERSVCEVWKGKWEKND